MEQKLWIYRVLFWGNGTHFVNWITTKGFRLIELDCFICKIMRDTSLIPLKMKIFRRNCNLVSSECLGKWFPHYVHLSAGMCFDCGIIRVTPYHWDCLANISCSLLNSALLLWTMLHGVSAVYFVTALSSLLNIVDYKWHWPFSLWCGVKVYNFTVVLLVLPFSCLCMCFESWKRMLVLMHQVNPTGKQKTKHKKQCCISDL